MGLFSLYPADSLLLLDTRNSVNLGGGVYAGVDAEDHPKMHPAGIGPALQVPIPLLW